MNTLGKLVKGSLKSNRTKSILISLTIVLTTILLSSVALISLHEINEMKENAIKSCGTFHGVYKRINKEELNIVENNIGIEEYGVLKTVGYSEADDSNLTMAYSDKNALDMSNVKFLEGNIPSNENEIAIQDGYLKTLGIENANIGQKVNIEYQSANSKDIKNYEFKLCGIIESTEVNKANKSYSGIVSEAFMNNEEYAEKMDYNIFIRVTGAEKLSGDEIIEKVKTIASDIGISNNVGVNESYIKALYPDSDTITGAVVIALIIIVSSILVIYSIFYVSIVNKVQEYGKLRALGATKRQIRKMILREGFILATISIPVGILFGYLISNLVLLKVSNAKGYGAVQINMPIILGTFIIMYVTVFVSLIKPMSIASKVSPVEAMRYNGDQNSKKQRKGYKEITLKKLTYANLSRNKKKTIITLASLSLSGMLFIATSTLMSSINARDIASKEMLGDFTLELDNYESEKSNNDSKTTLSKLQENNPLGQELRDKISAIDGVTDIKIEEMINADYTLPSGEDSNVSFGGYDDEMLKKLQDNLVEGEIDQDSLLSGEGIVFTYPQFAKEDGIKVGDKVQLFVHDGDKKVSKEFKVVAISAVYKAEFMVPNAVKNEIVKSDVTETLGIIVDSNKKSEVQENLKSLVENNGFIKMNSIDDKIKEYEKALDTIKILGYSLVGIIGGIGFINLINTMITSIIMRKKELGMLQAIGLSDKQLVKMLQIEGLFYSIGTIIMTLTLGNGLGYYAFSLFKNAGASFATYHYPLVQTFVLIAAVIAIQIAITYLVTNNFKKDSLVDRIRYSL